jgi:hypothetical protein
MTKRMEMGRRRFQRPKPRTAKWLGGYSTRDQFYAER